MECQYVRFGRIGSVGSLMGNCVVPYPPPDLPGQTACICIVSFKTLPLKTLSLSALYSLLVCV